MNNEKFDLGELNSESSKFWCPKNYFYSNQIEKSELVRNFSAKGEAAVLILLRKSPKDGEIELFLNVRSDSVSSHQGEVAFPGGKRDGNDRNPVETALREAEEETGLPSEYVEVKGVLFPFRTRYDLVLYPVLGILSDNNYTPMCNAEVETAFWLPLRRFLSDSGHKVRSAFLGGREFKTHTFLDTIPESGEAVVTWGITGYISVLLAMLVYDRKPEFPFPLQESLKDASLLSPYEILENVMEGAYKFFHLGAKSSL